jgi:hypothetical protein
MQPTLKLGAAPEIDSHTLQLSEPCPAMAVSPRVTNSHGHQPCFCDSSLFSNHSTLPVAVVHGDMYGSHMCAVLLKRKTTPLSTAPPRPCYRYRTISSRVGSRHSSSRLRGV